MSAFNSRPRLRRTCRAPCLNRAYICLLIGSTTVCCAHRQHTTKDRAPSPRKEPDNQATSTCRMPAWKPVTPRPLLEPRFRVSRSLATACSVRHSSPARRESDNWTFDLSTSVILRPRPGFKPTLRPCRHVQRFRESLRQWSRFCSMDAARVRARDVCLLLVRPADRSSRAGAEKERPSNHRRCNAPSNSSTS